MKLNSHLDIKQYDRSETELSITRSTKLYIMHHISTIVARKQTNEAIIFRDGTSPLTDDVSLQSILIKGEDNLKDLKSD